MSTSIEEKENKLTIKDEALSKTTYYLHPRLQYLSYPKHSSSEYFIPGLMTKMSS